MKQIYIASVQLAIEAQSEAHASDFISEMLDVEHEPGKIYDWQYLVLGGQKCSPTEAFVEEPYSEGDAFN